MITLRRCLAVVAACMLSGVAGTATALVQPAWMYNQAHVANAPIPWLVDVVGDGRLAPVQQMVMDDHDNWTWINFNAPCSGTTNQKTTWGNLFINYHRELSDQYDRWRLANGYDRVELWDPSPGVVMVGDGENTTTAYGNCKIGAPRPAGTVCTTCKAFPAAFVGPDSLSTYASVGLMGLDLQCRTTFNNSWHSQLHVQTTAAGGGVCGDMNDYQWNPNDPIFWMTHRKPDVTARDYNRLQATDVVLVLDRSAAMDDNCPGGNANADETPCRLNDATLAARMFVDLLQKVRPGGGALQHRVGLVTYGSGAVKEMGGAFVAANGAVTNDGVTNTTLESALAAVTAGGTASVASGIEAARQMLAASTAPHRAIVVIAGGANDGTASFSARQDSLADIDLAVIGFGGNFSDPEDSLRTLAESHGGVFLADADLTDAPVTLWKQVATVYGHLSDESTVLNPAETIPAGQVSNVSFTTTACSTDRRLTFIAAHDVSGANAGCDLSWNIVTPAGNLVNLTDPNVEQSHGPEWSMLRVTLPYRGESAGTWIGALLRPQTTFVNPFATDAFTALVAGTSIVRNEIHRLIPAGAATVLYYEDGSKTGNSVYRNALNADVAAGTITTLTTAVSAADFNTKLAQSWDLIVFARQITLTAQVYDAALQAKICGGQKAILTDFYSVGANAILSCAGTTLGSPTNYASCTGDGRFFAGTIGLKNTTPAYPAFAYTATASGTGGPWLVQARTPTAGGCIVGNGTTCGQQDTYYAGFARGLGRVEATATRPRVLVGQPILATFRLTESNRPSGGFSAISGTVTLDRPGVGALETYTLADNGGSGDICANNSYFSYGTASTIATVPGPHTLHASFNLTNAGCVLHREADYTVWVDADPAIPFRVTSGPTRVALGGDSLNPLVCVVNRAAATDSFVVTVSDTRGWLVDRNNVPIAGSASYHTGPVGGDSGICTPEMNPLWVYVRTPVNAKDGDSTVVTYSAHSLGHPAIADQSATVAVRNITGIVSVPGPPNVGFRVTVGANPETRSLKFRISTPESGPASLRVYDIRGRLVTTLFDQAVPAGSHTVAWSGRDSGGAPVPSGVYLYRFAHSARQASGTVVFVR